MDELMDGWMDEYYEHKQNMRVRDQRPDNITKNRKQDKWKS